MDADRLGQIVPDPGRSRSSDTHPINRQGVMVKCVQILMGLAALVCNVAVSGEIERTLDVGFGFRVVLEAEPTGPGAFESIAHYKYLFYKDQNLGIYDTYSISPSGRYVVFQDAPTGDIVLFEAATAQRRIVAKFSGSLVHQYVWMKGRAGW